MHFSERLLDGAASRLVAFVVGKTSGEDDRAVNGADDLENAEKMGIAGEFISAIGALDAGEKTSFRKLLQNLGEDRQGDMVGIADFLGAGGPLTGQSKMAEGNQAVVGFFGELKHFNRGLKVS